MSKILFITEKTSFISEGIINHLKAQDFEVLTVKPDVTAISNFLKEDNGNDEEAYASVLNKVFDISQNINHEIIFTLQIKNKYSRNVVFLGLT